LNNVHDFDNMTFGMIKGSSHFKLEIEFKVFESRWLGLPSVTLPPRVLRRSSRRW
jgi:hypothetical protein